MDPLHRHLQNWLHRDGIAGGILVACSAGADSTVLADALARLDVAAALAYVDHGLRSEAAAEAEQVRALAQRHRLPAYTLGIDLSSKPGGESLQAAARRLRYAALEALARDQGYDWIALAHHADDQAETLLMSLLRGREGAILKPMPARRGRILRPLLELPRAELLAYLDRHALAYCEDPSNAEDKYLRNRIRHEVMPALERIHPNARAQLVERGQTYGAQFARVHAWRQELLELATSPLPYGMTLDEAPLRPLSSEDRWFALEGFLRPLGVNVSGIERAVHLLESQPGRRVFLPVGTGPPLVLWRERAGLVLDCRGLHRWRPEPAPLPATLCSGPWQVAVNCVKPGERADVRLPPAAGPPCLRPWQAGDRFQEAVGRRPKKLKRLLAEAAVPAHQKPHCLVITAGDEVVWAQHLGLAKLAAREGDGTGLRIRIQPNPALEGPAGCPPDDQCRG